MTGCGADISLHAAVITPEHVHLMLSAGAR